MIAALAVSPMKIELDDGTLGHSSRTQRLSFLVPLCLILIGFSIALACILYNPKQVGLISRKSWSSGSSRQPIVHRVSDPPQTIRASAHWGLNAIRYLIFTPLIAFTVQILLAMLSVVLVLSQKFAAPADPVRFCGLQDRAENLWGFGQLLSIFMLILPAIGAGQTYLEGRTEIREGFIKD